jgi:hypothetical protein
MSETIESLKEQIRKMQNERSLMVKQGTLVFVHEPEHVSEKFSKIECGIDCSEIINGRPFPDFTGFQVTKYRKEIYADFDKEAGTNKFDEGDEVIVKLECAAVAVNKSKKTGSDVIYNNVSIVDIKLVRKAKKSNEIATSEPAQEQSQLPASTSTAVDDLPF